MMRMARLLLDFWDLPAELRVRIYTIHMNSMSTGGDELVRYRRSDEISHFRMLCPPPIAQVCTLLRQETMPMFFHIFRLEMRRINLCGDTFGDWNFEQSPPQLWAGHIQKIGLGYRIGGHIHYHLDIDLATPFKAVRIARLDVLCRGGGRLMENERRRVSDMLKKEVLRLLEPKDQGPGSTKLTRADYVALFSVAPQVHNQLNSRS